MKTRLSIVLGALSLFPLSCREEPKKTQKPIPPKIEQEKDSTSDKKPLISVPAGAVITDLTLPYYNKSNQKVSLLTIKELTVADAKDVEEEVLLSARTLKLWLFDRNGAIRSTTTIPAATYHVNQELLEADGEILMIGSQKQFAAKSAGGSFSLATGQALLIGPATTRFETPQKKNDSTAMKFRHLIPLGASAPILIAAPPVITPEQLADFERKVAPRIIPYIDGEKTFEAGEQLNRQVTARLKTYLTGIGQSTLISEAQTPVTTEEEDPLEGLFEPSPQSFVIRCSKGLYLDGENREIVYLGEIKIEGRGLTMTCQRDLKAIFNPPPAPPKKEEKKDPKKKKDDDLLTKFGGFGDLKQFTATGKVRLNGVNENGKKVYLGGDRALYEMTKNGEETDSTITMRGDRLTFMLGDPNDPKNEDGTVALQSLSPDAWVVAEIKKGIIKARFSGSRENGDNHWETVVLTPKKKGE